MSQVASQLDRSRDGVAKRLARAHFRVDPSIQAIYRILSDKEESFQEPIKLLEVNTETIMSGIMPVSFGPHSASGIFYASTIVEVRPEEFERIQRGDLQLPEGWFLGDQYLPEE
ncbi:MAG: hypothetical protein ABFD92_11275 [Planctomycetaceae bacterium]|nr:hypothetical protein [Planctomycetaceae bacterium]